MKLLNGKYDNFQQIKRKIHQKDYNILSMEVTFHDYLYHRLYLQKEESLAIASHDIIYLDYPDVKLPVPFRKS